MNGDLTQVAGINQWASSEDYKAFVKKHEAQGRRIASKNAAHKLPRVTPRLVAPKTVFAQGRQVALA